MITLEKIISASKGKIPKKQIELATVFIEQFYEDANWSDFTALSADELASRSLSLWELCSQRESRERKIEVFNPTLKVHGWECAYTLIELVQDDMPFIVDSLQMEINRLGYNIHAIIHLGGIKTERNNRGEITKIVPIKSPKTASFIEAPIYIEIDRQLDERVLQNIKANLIRILSDVANAVGDYEKMRQKVSDITSELEQSKGILDVSEVNETQEFLKWLVSNNFVFLGFRSYDYARKNGKGGLALISGSSYGVLKDEAKSRNFIPLDELPEESHKAIFSKNPIVLSKTDTISTVHRSLYIDSVIIKRFNDKGEIVGAHRFIGLYSTVVSGSSIRNIPIIRKKLDVILSRFSFPRNGYASRSLVTIMENLPRDDCFQADVEELYDMVTGIFQLHERRLTKLFLRRDIYNRYVSCLVYMPRENFNTEIRMSIQEVLLNAFGGTSATFNILFSDSVLCRLHIVVKIDPTKPFKIDINKIEKKIVAISSSWLDGLREQILNVFGEVNSKTITDKYAKAFPSSFRERFTPEEAILDIKKIERLSVSNNLEISFYNLKDKQDKAIGLKLFQLEQPISLSDTLPILENFGFKVVSEESYEVKLSNLSQSLNSKTSIWVSDFSIAFYHDSNLKIAEIEKTFHEAFSEIWKGNAENDNFNKLLLKADLTWREISVLRAYAKYLRQISFPFSSQYIGEALANNHQIAKSIFQFFDAYFDPKKARKNQAIIKDLMAQIKGKLEGVSSIDEERVLGKFLSLIEATVRTNYYQNELYISFKFSCKNIPELPLPQPLFEIFVYSPRFEATHMRMAKVARGGIRWSDRKEDFRTEILSLMKAQQVKNVVIVPYGAKGGFVLKKLPPESSREAILSEGVYCYKCFINALLDLTDNISDGKIIPPKNVVRYDDDDPYLVVAADKGTATFSDTANAISKEYNFWLGDAFASGGSLGYDHKKMGITAKGAWESVKYNFYELGINTQTTDFTVIGIGDMSGDVFGNGMLLSEHIKLVGAFNHSHIFLDPNPDPDKSFKERYRLFNLPQSTWEDYDKTIISVGGGVYKRSVKSIKLSNEIKTILDIKNDSISPHELIKALLRAPVDLIWNGGIGTYVKASAEINDSVGDRTNDVLRVNANELRCKVVAEGGNLGLTQLARVEYALSGGVINTDFIDNSGGVDCSDHEVNIKILLNSIVAKGNLHTKERNTLLAKMTNDISDLVLQNNHKQVRAISLISSDSAAKIDVFSEYIYHREQALQINRVLEFLPNNKEFLERKAKGQGLTRPEIAVLLAYSKLILKEELLSTDLPDLPFFHKYLIKEFPISLVKKYDSYLNSHRLRRDIICTQLSNDFVTKMGITFTYEIYQQFGVSSVEVVKAFVIVNELFDFQSIFSEIDKLEPMLAPDVYKQIIFAVHALMSKSIKWLLNNFKNALEVENFINMFKAKLAVIHKNINNILASSVPAISYSKLFEKIKINVPDRLIDILAERQFMLLSLNIVKISISCADIDILDIANVYVALKNELETFWLQEKINSLPISSNWHKIARSLIKNDLEWLERALCVKLLKNLKKKSNVTAILNTWLSKNGEFCQRWKSMISEIRQAELVEFDIIYIIIRELFNVLDLN